MSESIYGRTTESNLAQPLLEANPFLWPARCTLSFYNGRGRLLACFGNRYRRLDLSDSLMLSYPGSSRVVHFGIRSDSTRMSRWNEDTVKRYERLIKYDLGFDGYRVSIRRESPLGEPCSKEFCWRLAIRTM